VTPVAFHQPPVPLLFLLADTGGGHRSAALAVRDAIDQAQPGRFAVTFCDPLGGRGVPRPLRLLTGLYGPAVRLAAPAWAAAYYLTDSRPAVWLLERTVLALAVRPVAAALARHSPALIVSFHPLAGPPAGRARRRAAAAPPLLTVVTDLAGGHASWQGGRPERIVAPAAGTASLPVGSAFRPGPVSPEGRGWLRQSLGLRPAAFTVLLAGGAEGCGALARQAAAILRLPGDLQVAVSCGRNQALRCRLDRLARRDSRLIVLPFVPMADWLRAADVCVTKAGPATIAEAACCGTPLLLTSHLPGQERGNIELVAGAGAGRRASRRPARLAAEVGQLRADPAALTVMRAAARRLASPGAAGLVAAAIAALASSPASPGPDKRAGDGRAAGTACPRLVRTSPGARPGGASGGPGRPPGLAGPAPGAGATTVRGRSAAR
jgi:1,2-diacylglycerol 3-beta-galactosyltransferase